jgi:hypothetical protein
VERVQHIREADLGSAAREALEAVRRGELVVIDGDGREEAAIVDLVDHRILRAAARYHAERPEIDPDAGLSDQAVAKASDPQVRYDLVWAHYLAGAISLARAGELLGLAWIDLRTRCRRLGLPIRTGPETIEELLDEVAAMQRRLASSPQ